MGRLVDKIAISCYNNIMTKLMKKGLIMRLIAGFIAFAAFTPVAHAFEAQYGPYFGFIANPDLNFSIRHLAFIDNYQPVRSQPYQASTWTPPVSSVAPAYYQPYQPPQYHVPHYSVSYYQPQISPLNQKPVAYPIPAQTVRAGERVSFTVRGYDQEGDYLQYMATNVPHGANFNSYPPIFSWTPTLMQVGRYSVNFRVSQGGAAYADTSVSIIVLHPDGYMPISTCIAGPGPYFFAFNSSLNAAEGNLYTYQVIGNAANNNQLTYRIVDGPQGLTINEKSGYMRWVPAFNQGRIQPYEVRIGIYNGVCESVRTFTIMVEDIK